MQHYQALEEVQLQGAWVTIGSFDGVHLGHQKIIRTITGEAHKTASPAVVITFFPHPAVVLGKRNDPFYLTIPEERAQLLGQMGVDVVITHPFDKQVASMTASEFMTRLQQHLGIHCLCVGQDFALGRNREGNVPALRALGEQLGYSVQIIDPVMLDGELVSSSAIRAHLAAGRVERAARMLGRPFSLRGEVVPGDGRGRLIGIPTANLDVWSGRALPGVGVYVCRTQVNGRMWGAVANIGVRPTFENQPATPRVEAHLLDYDDDLYGQELPLEFIARLRDERRFSGVEALVAQIQADIGEARKMLEA